MGEQSFQAPKGTRDFYPIEMARRRWIEDKWRKVAIRHGFEEIDGPTFEETALYTAKSGEGIVGEIFGVYSGKDEASVKQMGAKLASGERGAIAPYALRPEFTPTLARMYAARAKQLPQPTKWFWQGPCFRAERPQRGRLREFWQWNCDILGTRGSGNAEKSGGDEEKSEADAEVIACCVDLLRACGFGHEQVSVRFSHRKFLAEILVGGGVDNADLEAAIALVDAREKLSRESFRVEGEKLGMAPELMIGIERLADYKLPLSEIVDSNWAEARLGISHVKSVDFSAFAQSLRHADIADWCAADFSLARGLAYYTGMVFEVIVDGERAVAGGGRYDNLIETFGGPPTPAVGFGMGDVVLSLVLQDKGLMPSDAVIARELGLRPDAFVISNGVAESDAAVAPMLATLRRAGLHARRSYKSTKNIGKLLKEASDAGSRFAVIIETASEITVKDLDDNTQAKVPLTSVLEHVRPPAR